VLLGFPGTDVGADRVHAREIVREQIRVAYPDPEPFFQEDHQPEQAQRVEDAGLQQRRVVGERQQRLVLDEFPADVVVDDGFHLSSPSVSVS
jgi:hypothetical protein